MNNGNRTYNAIAAFINGLQRDPHEVAHAITLLAAQMPHTSPNLIEVFVFADNIQIEDHGRGLTRLDNFTDPVESYNQFAAPMPDIAHEVHELPNSDERPEVRVDEHPTTFNSYIADKHNTGVLCKFHSKTPPLPDDFAAAGAKELVNHFAYAHIEGGFNVRHQPGADSIVQLFGAFTIDSFIPVSVVVNKPEDDTNK